MSRPVTAFGLLLAVKARLLWRSLARRGGAWAAGGLALLALALSPMWLGLSSAAHRAVARFGADGAVAVLASVHAGWLFSAFLFAAFTEGFDLRMMLRYPVRPATVFALNVLLAPVDLVGLFLFAPLVAAVLAAAHTTGMAAATAVGVAAVLTVLLTGVVLQILLAALGRLLRREWSRAVAGLLFGLAFAAPVVAIQGGTVPASARDAAGVLSTTVDRGVPAAARLARLVPTTALPALVVRAGHERRPALAAAGIAGSIALLVAGVLLGARLATAAALAPESTSPATVAPAGAVRPRRRRAPLARSDLALLVGRELRTWSRTPQIVLGLLLTPVMVLFFFAQDAFSLEARTFFLPLFCLVSVFNVSANQYGLDREGVRLLFLLPLEPRRLIVGKNLASVSAVAAQTLLALALVSAIWGVPAELAAIVVTSVAAILPVLLMAGNHLSVRHPWRMTFKIGGAPPGALASALAQFLVVGLMAVLLAVPLLVGRFVVGGALVTVGGTVALGALAWWIWYLGLPRAARALTARREHLLATLAYPHETG